MSVTKKVKTAAVGKEWKHLLGRYLENVSFINCNKRAGIFSGQEVSFQSKSSVTKGPVSGQQVRAKDVAQDLLDNTTHENLVG